MDLGTPWRLPGKSPALHTQLPGMEEGSAGMHELPWLHASFRDDVPFAPGTDPTAGFPLWDWPHAGAQPPGSPLPFLHARAQGCSSMGSFCRDEKSNGGPQAQEKPLGGCQAGTRTDPALVRCSPLNT